MAKATRNCIPVSPSCGAVNPIPVCEGCRPKARRMTSALAGLPTEGWTGGGPDLVIFHRRAKASHDSGQLAGPYESIAAVPWRWHMAGNLKSEESVAQWLPRPGDLRSILQGREGVFCGVEDEAVVREPNQIEDSLNLARNPADRQAAPISLPFL